MHYKDCFCFVHIEKTAGTTVHQLLKENYPSYIAIHPVYLTGKAREQYLLRSEQLEALVRLRSAQGVGGHPVRSTLGYHESDSVNPIYFTFLRDPLLRYISMYHFVNKHFGLNRSFDEYLDMPVNANWQCERICGARDASTAIKEIQRYRFIGLVESFEESLVYLNKYVFNWNLRLRFFAKRVASRTDWRAGITDAQMERAKENNAEDIALYEYVKNKLYSNYTAEYDPNLEGPFVDARQPNRSIYMLKGVDRYITEPLSYLVSRSGKE